MPSPLRGLVAAALTTLALVSAPPAGTFARAPGRAGRPAAAPVVIGHRGASGYRPEHTLAAYELAARMGADFIEPDLVTTSDGVLVARHEPEIGGTTDVAARPEFAERRTTKTIDGVAHDGWFAEDFTLAELRTLRATERIPEIRQENTIYDGRYRVPTFDEVLALRERLSDELGREIGVYPETKSPSYFASIGRPLEPALVAAIERAGLNRPDAPVFVQSFETQNLRALRGQLKVGLIQLMQATGAPADLAAAGDPRGYADLVTPQGLADIATYADGIGPDKDLVIGRDASEALGEPTALVTDAHAVGLLVHPYTFRNENRFLPAQFRSHGGEADYGDAFAEYEAFLRAGVDGVFTDSPDTAVAARAALLDPVG
ncbi:glycerophosphodiester phosphodiesterase [Pseudonocardia bannensis]|uniref:glycerophosphodiester phosphodiesterase n=1 Tax=Pseudonocardia bannensis TaxID=630973 RepID=A0A848DDJ9_9PSEU|nr:glycerophosphodiester phosphodiesterase [Pseudonocardia bannensis]NMH90680.1 glycerophosphodiester phosphodiesterase [Pseudonocardia bannensis]